MSYGRLTAENAAILFVDHQTGLSNLCRTKAFRYVTAVAALTRLAKTFKLLAVITTSAADGPNGPDFRSLPRPCPTHRYSISRRDRCLG